jgi:hypothetical protein
VTLKMFFESLGVFLLTLFSVIVLLASIPFTGWGWAKFFLERGGNVLVSPMLEASQAPDLLSRLLAPTFFAAFLFAIPFLAKTEEDQFRKGCVEWKRIVPQSIKFGFIHMIVGVPIAVGIALTGVGFFYAYKYRQAYNKLVALDMRSQAEDEAVMTSTAYHTVYNTIAIGGILVVTISLV